MRILIAAAVLACAAAAPSGLLGHGYLGHAGPLALGHAGPLALGHAAPLALGHAAPLGLGHAHLGYAAGPALALAPAAPTISSGDLQGAAIEAHVDATDHARAAVDAAREYHDQTSELHGQALNAAEDHSWQAVDAVKTAEAQLDGQAAGVAPILAKQLAGHGAYGNAAYGHAAYAAPAYGHAALAPAGYAAPGLVGHAPLLAASHGLGGSTSYSSQSLSQTHPAPLVHAAPLLAHSAPLLAHGAPLLAHGAPLGYGHGLAHGW